MDKFLDTYSLLTLNQVEIKSPNTPIMSYKFESVINSLSTKKSPGPDTFTAKFYQIYKEELVSFLLNFSKNFRRRDCFLISRGSHHPDTET